LHCCLPANGSEIYTKETTFTKLIELLKATIVTNTINHIESAVIESAVELYSKLDRQKETTLLVIGTPPQATTTIATTHHMHGSAGASYRGGETSNQMNLS